MLRRLFLATVALAALGVGFRASPAAADDARLLTYMFGASERPGPGDADGAGRTVIQINDAANQLCATFQFGGVTTTYTGLHIHVAPDTAPGPVVIPFSVPTSSNSTQCVTVANEALLDNIAANPQQYYCNVHNSDFPAGALRGQLKKI